MFLENEGVDRHDINLPDNQLLLLKDAVNVGQ